MAKISVATLQNLDNPNTAVGQINSNFSNVSTAMDNTLSRDGTSPNQMQAVLDMNSNRIINLPEPENAAEPVRLADLPALVEDAEEAINDLIDQAEIDLNTIITDAQVLIDADVAAAAASEAAAELAETNAETAASNAATSEANAATSESNASTSEANAAASEADAEAAELGAEAALAATEALLAAFPTITSTDTSANAGPTLRLTRNSASPAASDLLGQIVFRGKDSAGNDFDYAYFNGQILSPTDGTEGGAIVFTLAGSGATNSTVAFRENMVRLSGAAGSNREYLFLTSGSVRWALRTSSTAESGSDAGSDFQINSYTDAGAFKESVVGINRATGTMTFTRTDDGAAVGPLFVISRVSASPAGSDALGQITFRGRDSGGNAAEYVTQTAYILDPTNGSEDGQWNLTALEGGVDRTIVTANASATTLYKTDDSATAGPNLKLFRSSDSPAVSDNLGQIQFSGRDSAGNSTTYGSITGVINSPTDAAETGRLAFSVLQNGSEVTPVIVAGTETQFLLSDDSASAGPSVILTRNTASPAASDALGQIIFRGRDSAQNATSYANIIATISDPVDGTEDATLSLQVMSGGALTTGARITNLGVAVDGGAVLFPSTQVPSSNVNALDDYEEGAWTPAISFGGGVVGQTYTQRSGTYIKVGRLVVCKYRIQLSAKGSSTGNAALTGLPFTSATSTDRASVQANYQTGLSSVTSQVHGIVTSNATTADLYHLSGGASTAMTEANFTDSLVIHGTVVYEASA